MQHDRDDLHRRPRQVRHGRVAFYATYNLRSNPRTVNEYYEAPKPWGPWTKFKTVETGELGWYVPIIGQKFQTTVDSNTVNCFLYPTGNYQNRALYKLDYIPVTLSTVPLASRSAKPKEQ